MLVKCEVYLDVQFGVMYFYDYDVYYEWLKQVYDKESFIECKFLDYFYQ